MRCALPPAMLSCCAPLRWSKPSAANAWAPCGADITREEALGKPVIELFPSSNMKVRGLLALPE